MRIAPPVCMSWFAGLPAALLLLSCLLCVKKNDNGSDDERTAFYEQNKDLFKDIDRLLVEKIMKITRELAGDPVIIEFVHKANQMNRDVTFNEIKQRDETWRNDLKKNDLVTVIMNNSCSKMLMEWQKKNSEYSEIFITDERGLNIAQTNRTSDYLQADEKWWADAYNNGRGVWCHGDIDYDESSRQESIALYIPVIGPDNEKTIGIIKSVCSVLSIKEKL